MSINKHQSGIMKNIVWCIDESNKKPLSDYNLSHKLASGTYFCSKIIVTYDDGKKEDAVIIDFEHDFRLLKSDVFYHRIDCLKKEINEYCMLYDFNEGNC